MTDGTQDREALITLTSDIVAAHVSNNNVTIDQVSVLISSVFDALSGLGADPAAEEAPLEPAVSIRASVRPDHVTCLECGKKMKMLKRHLTTDHNLTTEEYRQRWGLSADHALVAPSYAAQRAELAKKIGLGQSRRGGRKGKVAVATTSAAAKPASKAKAKPASPAKVDAQPAAQADAKQSKRSGLIKRLNKKAEGADSSSG